MRLTTCGGPSTGFLMYLDGIGVDDMLQVKYIGELTSVNVVLL